MKKNKLVKNTSLFFTAVFAIGKLHPNKGKKRIDWKTVKGINPFSFTVLFFKLHYFVRKKI